MDVSVRDAKTGEPVRDLRRTEFDVWVDGVRQNVATAVLVRDRMVVVFVDDLHLDFKNTGKIRDLVRRMAKEIIHDGDLFGIVSSGPSSLAIGLTSDRKWLDETIGKISGAGLRPKEIIAAPPGANGPPEVMYRAHVALTTACEQIVRLQEYRGRRKSVIYVSDGYDAATFAGAAGSRTNAQPRCPQTVGTAISADALRSDFADLVGAARRVDASIHTMNVAGLTGSAMDPDQAVDPAEWEKSRKAQQASLRELSAATGGFSVRRAEELGGVLQQIAAAAIDYYRLEYYSGNQEPHAIEVKVRRPGTLVGR